MHKNFNGCHWDIISGWDTPDDKTDMPECIRDQISWYPLWDESHLIDLPKGVTRVMVGFTGVTGHPYGRCEILYWQPQERNFSFDPAGKMLIDEQMLTSGSAWALLPDVPYFE